MIPYARVLTCLSSISVGALVISASMFSRSHATEATKMQGEATTIIHQLRIYEIFANNKSAFHARFRDHAARIMQRYGFQIVAMWETSHMGRIEFVYLLQWPDKATMDRKWEQLMADQEWSVIKEKTAAEHGQLVGEIQSRVLHLTRYSPQGAQ